MHRELKLNEVKMIHDYKNILQTIDSALRALYLCSPEGLSWADFSNTYASKAFTQACGWYALSNKGIKEKDYENKKLYEEECINIAMRENNDAKDLYELIGTFSATPDRLSKYLPSSVGRYFA